MPNPVFINNIMPLPEMHNILPQEKKSPEFGKVKKKPCYLQRVISLFLDATTHLYKRSCPSVRRSVYPQLFSNQEFGQL